MKTKKIKVKCFTYTVHFTKASSDHGETDSDNKNIYINTTYPLEVQRETLNHELLHVCLDDFPNFGKDKMDKEEQEEEIVRYQSPTMVQIYRDNKWLRDFVFGAK